MFGIGHWELLVVLFVALLMFGKRLPMAARNVGRSMISFKEGLQGIDVRSDIEEAVSAAPHSTAGGQASSPPPE